MPRFRGNGGVVGATDWSSRAVQIGQDDLDVAGLDEAAVEFVPLAPPTGVADADALDGVVVRTLVADEGGTAGTEDPGGHAGVSQFPRFLVRHSCSPRVNTSERANGGQKQWA